MMSSTLPEFEVGQRVRIMQTDGMVKLGVATICGTVKSRENSDFYIVDCADGKTRKINACVLNGILEEDYKRWINNGLDPAKGLTEADIPYDISPYSGNIEWAKKFCQILNP